MYVKDIYAWKTKTTINAGVICDFGIFPMLINAANILDANGLVKNMLFYSVVLDLICVLVYAIYCVCFNNVSQI
jgi:hypothetical protein